jgi:putative hydroxymethylpyrimidine transport system substrate-binding protein
MLACAVALLSGCGSGEGEESTQASAKKQVAAEAKPPPERPREVWVTSQGWESPADLGILVAEREGFFRKAGLNVWFGSPAKPNRPIEYVTGGTDLLGVTQQPEVAIAKEKGAPIVSVGSVVKEPTAAMIWLKKDQIGGIADLKGKTIGIPGLQFQQEFLADILGRAGLTLDDVKVEIMGYDLVPALLNGRADAIFGGSANQEGIELRAHGAQPVITPVEELGVPPYEELVLIAREDLVEEDPKLIRDFLAAMTRGVEVARKNPRLAVKILKEGGEANPEVSWKEMEAEVKATLPLLSRTAYMDPDVADGLLSWMHETGMIEDQPPASDLYANDYLGR